MKRVIVGLIAASTLFAFPVDAVAAVPDHVSWSGSYIDPHFLQCEGFEIVSAPAAKALQRCSSTRAGSVERVLVETRATDVLTNSVTGNAKPARCSRSAEQSKRGNSAHSLATST